MNEPAELRNVMKTKVYLLPGTMCNQRLWHKLIACAEANFEFIHIPIPANKDIRQIAQWLNSYLIEDKVCLLGFSLGGYIASYFAVKYPHRIKQLLVVGNSPCRLSYQEVTQRQQLLNFVSTNKYKGVSHQRASQLLDSNNDELEHINTIKQMDSELGVDELVSQMTYTTERDDLLEPLSQFKNEITFYYSEQDPLINLAWLQQLADSNTHCRLVVSNGNGHMLPLEKPEALAQLMEQTFGGISLCSVL
ncbi:alpha/beta hydrolase [Psychrosphaera sp. F3M07]|nr:alpha/beta hydrolase [Psychrosphaera sp. F3M07]